MTTKLLFTLLSTILFTQSIHTMERVLSPEQEKQIIENLERKIQRNLRRKAIPGMIAFKRMLASVGADGNLVKHVSKNIFAPILIEIIDPEESPAYVMRRWRKKDMKMHAMFEARKRF